MNSSQDDLKLGGEQKIWKFPFVLFFFHLLVKFCFMVDKSSVSFPSLNVTNRAWRRALMALKRLFLLNSETPMNQFYLQSNIFQMFSPFCWIHKTWTCSSTEGYTRVRLFLKVTLLPWNTKSSSGQGLFSPEAAICLGMFPALNHCVCFYGLRGPVCTP